MKKSLIALATLAVCATAFAGNNRFTASTFETPSGKRTKVMSNTNSDGYRLVVACANKTIGNDFSGKGKILLVAQDWDVVTHITALGGNRIQVATRNGWDSVFKAASIPKC
ncbi:hypothetical protein [Neisseria leonii]|uniref:hypothetical protein n=2 Tax=Neisseria leonii TaxID=2995413 RepID=UPI00237A82B2|nr:hypothetical protein [Neisseria sp. 3986]MDD9325754.1 hypothetical protein [Neisseria sp. 3986]